MAMRCGQGQLLSVVAAAALLAGCAALGKPAKGPTSALSAAKKGQSGVPVKMAAIWSPAVLNRPGETPMRGFGGRLYFYDAENRPVAVEGQLMVYAYDDSNPYSDGKAPDRKFAFTAEQFAQHYSPTELGDSYSIWIPWDAVGQPQVEVSLVPILTTTSGQLVIGQPSRALLPGPRTPPTVSRIEHSQLPPPQIRYEARLPGTSAVQPAAYQTAVSPTAGTPFPGQGTPPASYEAASKPAAGVEALTIPLPGTLADRLAQAGPQQVNPLTQLAMKRAVAAPGTGAAVLTGAGPSVAPATPGPSLPGGVPPMALPFAGTATQAGASIAAPAVAPGLTPAAAMPPLAAGGMSGPTFVPPRPAPPLGSPAGSTAGAMPVRPPAPSGGPGLVPQDAP